MRALGPGSVSSFLKMALDVVYVLLWIALVTSVVLVFGALVMQPFIASQVQLEGTLNGETDPERIRELIRSPVIPALFTGFAVYVGGFVFIVGRLRRIFVTLSRGDPFQPDNVRRLRLIGFALAAIELFTYVARVGADWVDERLPDDAVVDLGEGFDLTIWFAVLVVFVLAEVFREGARLRREAELTI